MARKRNIRNTTKFKRSIKAISPVIATLLMIAIAVVASLVVYAWVSGYLGFQTGKAGKAIQIPSFALNSDNSMTVYVQNVGQGTVQIGPVYVDNEQKVDFTNDATKQIGEGDSVSLTIPGSYNKDTRYDIKVTTKDGTFITTTGKPGTGGSTNPGTPAALDHFTIDTIASPKAPNVAFSITIRAVDQNGNPYTSYVGTNTITSSGSISPATTGAFTAGVWTGDVTFSSAVTSVTIQTTGDTKTGTSNSFDVANAPAALDHFDINTISSPQTVGTAYSITITAKDQYGDTFTGYTGNPTLTSSSWTGNLQIGAFVAGTKTGTVTSTTAGSTTITATDGTTTGTSNSFTVNNPAAVLDHFTFDTITSPKTAGTAFSITIRAIDQYGNAFTSYTGTNALTVSSGTINPTTSGAFTAGVRTVSVTLTGSGTGITISTSGSSKTGTSNSFTLSSAPALDHFTFDTISTPKTAGTAFSITLRAIDQYGNPFTSYTGTNALTVSSGAISPTNTGSFTAGVWTGSVTLYTSGSGITIGTTGATKTGTSNSITVNAGSGTFGSTTQGTEARNIENEMRGGTFTAPGYSVTAQSISAYIQVTSTHTIKAAIYTSSGTFVGGTQEVSVTTSNDGWVNFAFTTKPVLNANTAYILVIWTNNPSGDANVYRTNSGSGGVSETYTYGNWPSTVSFGDSSGTYSVYCTYSIP